MEMNEKRVQDVSYRLKSTVSALQSIADEAQAFQKNSLQSGQNTEDCNVKLSTISSDLSENVGVLHMCINELLSHVDELLLTIKQQDGRQQKMHDNYQQKQQQLDLVLHQHNLNTQKIKQFNKEKRIMNWEKLFTQFTSRRNLGRRWRFRIASIQHRASLGWSDIQSLREELSRSDGEEANELKSDGVGDKMAQDSPTTLTGSDDIDWMKDRNDPNEGDSPELMKSSKFLWTEKVDLVDKSVEASVEQVSTNTWTHEPVCQWKLHVRVFAPEQLYCRELKCVLNMAKQTYQTGVLDSILDEESAKTGSKKPQQGVKRDIHKTKQKYYEEYEFAMPGSFLDPLLSQDDGLTLSISVLYGPYSEMIAMTVVELEDLNDLELHTVTVPPSRDADGVTDDIDDNRDSLYSQIDRQSPLLFPLQSLDTGLRALNKKPTGKIPLSFYWTKVIKPFMLNRSTNTELKLDDLNEYSLNAVDVPLDLGTRDQSLSPVFFGVFVQEEFVLKTEMNEILSTYEKEIEDIKKDYETKTSQLIERIDQLERMNTSPSIDPRPKSSSAQELDVKVSSHNIGTPKPQKRSNVGKEIPRWGSSMVEDFFERLELYDKKYQNHKEELIRQIWERVSHNIEMNMAVLNRLCRQKDVQVDPLRDLCLPALFMPIKTHAHFNPRAHQYFQPLGSTMKRISQPPSIFHLPPLSNTMLTNINLFELSSTFYKHGHANLVKRSIDQSVQETE